MWNSQRTREGSVRHLGLLATRALIGGLFVGHGTQKLFGWFGGPGLAGTTGMMGKLRMEPAKVNALLAGGTEAGGGALLLAGAATPLASASLIGTMITAIRTVHAPNGPWVTKGGWEYNGVLIAALLALAEEGPGPLSVDGLVGLKRPGLKGAIGALALGAVASTAAVAAGRAAAETQHAAEHAATGPAAPPAQ